VEVLGVTRKALFLTLLALVGSASAQAVKCIGVGWLHLRAPSNTIYCKSGGTTGKILWAVTYGAEKDQFILYSTQMKSFFYVPAQPNQRYIGSAVRGKSDAWYSMTSSVYEDEHQTFINLEGH
jgi:hypothetical protein